MARKNGNGEGSRPRKRPDGRWEARYWEESPSGRKKRRSVYGSSPKECADKLASAISTEEDLVLVPTDMTLSEFLAQHLEATKETLKKRTWEGHEETARVHLVPMLGHLKLKDLSRERVQSLYAAKRVGGLSPGTVRRIHAVLSAALSRAVRWRLVPYNVCKDADPPRAASPDLRLLNHKEARAFMVAAEWEPHHALYCSHRLGVHRSGLPQDRGSAPVRGQPRAPRGKAGRKPPVAVPPCHRGYFVRRRAPARGYTIRLSVKLSGHWSLPDPAAAQGTDEDRLKVFRSVRDRLRDHIEGELVNGRGG